MSALEKAHRLLAPRIAYLVGTRSPDGTSNIIPVSNVTSISTDPQQVAVAVYKQWTTRHNLVATAGFTLSVPCVDHLQGAWKLGARYSRYQYTSNAEKIAASGLPVDDAASKYGPILSNGIGWMTCRSLRDLDFAGDHTLFIGQVEQVHFNPAYLNSDGTPRGEIRPLMQVTGNTFTTAAGTYTVLYHG